MNNIPAQVSPEEQRFLDGIVQLCELARKALPGESVPCFAHLRIEPIGPIGPIESGKPGEPSSSKKTASAGGRQRDLLLGFRTVASPQLTILNWQTAPLSEVFFAFREGDEYEIEVGDHMLSGTVLARSLLTFRAGELVAVQTATQTFSRPGAGGPSWGRSATHAALLRPRSKAALRPVQPWSREALDPEQRRAVDLPAGQPLLVLGEAGCGKTTVALHRVAALRKAAEAAGRPFRGLVLVPAASAGLRHLSEMLLAKLGVVDVEVQVFDRWAGAQARRVFPRLPLRESQDVSPGVVQIKRHPALQQTLQALAARRRGGSKKGPGASRADLLHLFGDQVLLQQLAASAQGLISEEAVRQVLAHTRVQFSLTTEEASTHIDADRLVTVDGLRIDEGTPMGDAASIDTEDYPVLFALSALRTGAAAPGPTEYDCVVIDEAQEFAPIELALIGRAVRSGGSLIVAGDEAQQVDPSAYFTSFAGAMEALRARAFVTVTLAVSYRCPPAVTALARTLRNTAAPAPALPLEPADTGESVVRAGFDNECHLLTRLLDGLNDLRAADAGATVAVICRTPQSAERLARLLARGVDARLARDGDFRFAGPVEVTCVPEVKGLEFDYVIVPDAASAVYGDDAQARRALYVAMTRTAQQLVLACTGTWTTLLG